MELEENKQPVPQILIVDDVETNLLILKEIIESMEYEPICAKGVKEAVQELEKGLPHLILLDIFMPDIDGYEFCEKLKNNVITRDIPVIFTSAETEREEKWKVFEVGGSDLLLKPFDIMEVKLRVNMHIRLFQMKQELEQTNRCLHTIIDNQVKRIEAEQRNTLYALAVLTEEEQQGGNNHLDHIGYNCRILAQSLQFSPQFQEEISESFIETIGIASMLHDIGKLRAPGELRLKRGKLEPFDQTMIVEHTRHGAHILELIYEMTYKNEFLAMAIDIAKYHHARWDGKGYPDGIKEKQIPLSARIMAVADVYDILTSESDREENADDSEIVDLISSGSGTHYDPQIIKVFQKVRKQMRRS